MPSAATVKQVMIQRQLLVTRRQTCGRRDRLQGRDLTLNSVLRACSPACHWLTGVKSETVKAVHAISWRHSGPQVKLKATIKPMRKPRARQPSRSSDTDRLPGASGATICLYTTALLLCWLATLSCRCRLTVRQSANTDIQATRTRLAPYCCCSCCCCGVL